MTVPHIWGQGQIFAFSALDGEAYAQNDFVGTLSADKIGIRFHTKVVRELAIVSLRGLEPVFCTVASDIILLDTNRGQISVIYADTHTVIGQVAGNAFPAVMTEGPCRETRNDCLLLQDTLDGDYTAFLQQGSRFAFAYGTTEAAAIANAQRGIRMDPEAEAAKKLAFYRTHCLGEDHPYRLLYAKCLSVMKSQLYSPEGRFRRIWSTPDRLPHKNLWLWDSVFHAIGQRNLNPQLAQELILAVLDCQEDSGFIPHTSSPLEGSRITQPPVIGWGAWLVYEKSRSKAFLKTVLEANKKYLLWCRQNRRDTEEELYTWLTKDDINCRCDESGMDNSPRFDTHSRLQAIDYSCLMANDVRFMAKIAGELDDPDNEAFFSSWYRRICACVSRKLWCGEDGFYYDYDLTKGCLHKVQSVASFLPLFAGICTREQAESLVGYLTDPNTFGTPFPIPSISKRDPTYGTDMWRGPVWINYNYMIIQGLQDYGYRALAEQIREKTLCFIQELYLKTGTVYEFYDPEHQKTPDQLNRKGTPYTPYDFTVRYQSIRDYGWSNTLTLDLLHSRAAAWKTLKT